MRVFIPSASGKGAHGQDERFRTVAAQWRSLGHELVFTAEAGDAEKGGDGRSPGASGLAERLARLLAPWLPKRVDAVYSPSDSPRDVLAAVLARAANPGAGLMVRLGPAGEGASGFAGLRARASRAVCVWLARLGEGRILASTPRERVEALKLGAPTGSVSVAAPGLDAAFFEGARPMAATPRYDAVFPAGPYTPEEVARMAAVWRMVCEADSQARLGVVAWGARDDPAGLTRAAAGAHGLGACVEFAGVLSEEERARVLARAGCLCLPSRDWGFTRHALEAMACGTPVAGFGFEGGEEFFPGGMAVAQGDGADRLARVVLELKADPSRRSFLSAEARLVAARHDWAEVAHRELELIGKRPEI